MKNVKVENSFGQLWFKGGAVDKPAGGRNLNVALILSLNSVDLF